MAAETDVAEEHLISLLVLAPQLARQLPAALTPADFRRPECRELFRAIVDAVAEATGPGGAGGAGAVPRRLTSPAAEGDGAPDPIVSRVDDTLLAYYDRVRAEARRQPYYTESQLTAALTGIVRRIKERNLHEALREAQYLLQEAAAGDERIALERRVERLAAQLGRVQLERSRPALYTTPPN